MELVYAKITNSHWATGLQNLYRMTTDVTADTVMILQAYITQLISIYDKCIYIIYIEIHIQRDGDWSHF